jgi:hypothetical protein
MTKNEAVKVRKSGLRTIRKPNLVGSSLMLDYTEANQDKQAEKSNIDAGPVADSKQTSFSGNAQDEKIINVITSNMGHMDQKEGHDVIEVERKKSRQSGGTNGGIEPAAMPVDGSSLDASEKLMSPHPEPLFGIRTSDETSIDTADSNKIHKPLIEQESADASGQSHKASEIEEVTPIPDHTPSETPASESKPSIKTKDDYGATSKAIGHIDTASKETNLIPVHQRYISDTSGTHKRDISDTSGTHKRYISDTSSSVGSPSLTDEHKRYISDTSGIHKSNISDTSCTHKRDIGYTTANFRAKISATSAIHKQHDKRDISDTSAIQDNRLVYSNHKPVNTKMLTGLRRKIVVYIFEETPKNTNRVSNPISYPEMASELNTTSHSIRGTIKRLIEDGVLDRQIDGKKGRGSWVIFELPERLFIPLCVEEELGLLKIDPSHYRNISDTSAIQKRNISDTIRGTARSSSSLGISDVSGRSLSTEGSTTTAEPNADDGSIKDLSEEWREIDCGALHKLGIPFGPAQIKNVKKWGTVTPEELKLSIESFAFDITVNNKKLRTGQLNGFCGILKSGPYGPPDNFISEADKSKKENDARLAAYWNKRKQERAEMRLIKFDLWIDETPRQELRKYIPEAVRDFPFESDSVVACLKVYFRDNVLPVLEREEQDSKGLQTYTGESDKIRAELDKQFGNLT